VSGEAQRFSRISVIGLGYIGLPTAAMFASRRLTVIGVDVNASTVETINRGEIHIVEPDLDIAVHAAVSGGWLRATTVPEPADAFLIAVPTPFKGDNHEPDLGYIEKAAQAIAPVLAPGNLVVLESTSPVGATEQMAAWLAAARPDLSFPQTAGEASDIRIAHCPERVLPGKVMRELIDNDRVIGGMTPRCSALAASLYRLFVKGECVITDARTAEMAKLTENSFRDVNIAFANELSILCDRLGIDVWELIALANRHPRVNILQPGPGVGGHCIAVDPWFIVASAPEQARLIRTAREVNDGKPHWVLDQVAAAVAQAGGSPRIACYGLAFKPDIDDLRESPAVEIVAALAERFPGQVVAVEPNIASMPPALAAVPLVDVSDARNAAIHVMLVDHREFRGSARPAGVVVDTRGVWREGASW
jgi:UDP-N-acetyl-D-mannosaminuronic acid dehydrogenase